MQRSAILAKSKILALAPSSLSEVFENILAVGAAAGIAERAANYVVELERRVAIVRHRILDIPSEERPRVCVVEWFDPLIISGNWVPELVELGGGRSGLSQADSHSPTVDWKALLAFNPQVLILAPCGFDVHRAL